MNLQLKQKFYLVLNLIWQWLRANLLPARAVLLLSMIFLIKLS